MRGSTSEHGDAPLQPSAASPARGEAGNRTVLCTGPACQGEQALGCPLKDQLELHDAGFVDREHAESGGRFDVIVGQHDFG